jgi:hypothetical protein
LLTNPQRAEFLKAIELAESSEEEEPQTDNWNQLFVALQCIEHMFTSNSKQVVAALSSEPDLLAQIRFISWKHSNYWVRLVTQRVYGLLFSKSLTGLLANDIGEVQKLLYELLDGFKFNFVSDELAKQLVKNLVFLSRHAISQQEDIIKIYAKAAYIGRKLIGSKHESSEIKLLGLI